jgi:hypothetical protein
MDPIVPELFKMLEEIKEWRPPIKRGRRTYNDQTFVESLHDQFSRRRNLSTRQVIALKRIVYTYKAQISNFEERAQTLNLRQPSANEGELDSNGNLKPPSGEQPQED